MQVSNRAKQDSETLSHGGRGFVEESELKE